MKKLLPLVGPLVVAGVLFSTGALVASFTLLSQFRSLAEDFALVQVAEIACPAKTPDPKSCYVVATRPGSKQPTYILSRDPSLELDQWRNLANWSPQPMQRLSVQP